MRMAIRLRKRHNGLMNKPGLPTGAAASRTLDSDENTLFGETVAGTQAPGLTVVWHPDVNRIGDRNPLMAPEVPVSRQTPTFYTPAGKATGPLQDPYTSRRAVSFASDESGVEITGRCLVDGVEVDGQVSVNRERLVTGVTVELNRRIVLLLHHVPLIPAAGPDLGLIGDSPRIGRMRSTVGDAASSTAPVLIRGESGTGKTHVARALHQASSRRHAPLREINVGALDPKTAVQAFFGVAGGPPGYLAEAHGGTLLLDHISELPFQLQSTLMQAIETGEVEPVGGGQRRRVDVRFVSTADDRLERALDDGRVSRALAYRLAGVEIKVPPLRERRDDIARIFVAALRRELDALGSGALIAQPAGQTMWLNGHTIAPLCRYDWPGNVRELLHVARQVAFTGHRRPKVRTTTVPALQKISQALADAAAAAASAAPAAPAHPPPHIDSTPSPIDTIGVDEQTVIDTMKRMRWSVPAAAKALKVPPDTLQRYLDGAGLIRKPDTISDDEIREAWARFGGNKRMISDHLRLAPRAFIARIKGLELP